MSNLTEIQLETGWAAVRYAQEVRSYHRRSSERGAKNRETDIKVALDRLKRAMKPVRAYLSRGRTLRDNQAERVEMAKQLSASLQAERRKLWKMQDAKQRQARQIKAAMDAKKRLDS